jgi:hypothetical protein
MSLTRLSNPRRISSAGIASAASIYGLHDEAADWRSRVIANGGTVSDSTAIAVSVFCRAIDNASIRDRFYRLNLFCGNSDSALAAVRTPLYRGPSFSGTQNGGTLDTNFNFVAGDYAETGSTGGLLGNGSSKYLSTALNASAMPDLSQSGHLSVYAAVAGNGNVAIGLYNYTNPPFVVTHESELQTQSTNANTYINATANAQTPTFSYPAFIVSSRTSSTSLIGYANGSAGTTNTSTANLSNPALPFYVFCRNIAGSPTAYASHRLRAYSIGLGMTGSQVSAFNTAIQAFQTTLSRNT